MNADNIDVGQVIEVKDKKYKTADDKEVFFYSVTRYDKSETFHVSHKNPALESLHGTLTIIEKEDYESGIAAQIENEQQKTLWDFLYSRLLLAWDYLEILNCARSNLPITDGSNFADAVKDYNEQGINGTGENYFRVRNDSSLNYKGGMYTIKEECPTAAQKPPFADGKAPPNRPNF